MATRMRGALAGRGFVLFPAAAFAVHQLRYELGYGSRSGAALAAQGHGYENSLAPWVVVLVAIGLGSFLTRLARAASGGAVAKRRRPFLRLFAVAWALLLATYTLQEWLEGIFAAGHPAGLAGIVGHGGWWAAPLAAAAAAGVSLLLLVGDAVVEIVSRLARRPAVHGRAAEARPAGILPVRISPLAGRVAGRAPPRPGIAAV